MPRVEDRDINRVSRVALKTYELALRELPRGSVAALSDAKVDAVIPGFPFEIVGIQHFVRDTEATHTYKVKVGTKDAVAAVVTPADATPAAASLHGTAGNRRGGAADAINLHQDLSALAAGAPQFTGTGNGVLTVHSLGPLAKRGTYTIVCIAASQDDADFAVIDPDGLKLVQDGGGETTLPTGTSEVSYGAQLVLSLTDGNTDFEVGDEFTVDVTGGVCAGGRVRVTVRPLGLWGG